MKQIFIPKSVLFNNNKLAQGSNVLIEFDSPGYGDLIDITPLIHSLLKIDVKNIYISTNKNDLPLELICKNQVKIVPLGAKLNIVDFEYFNFNELLKFNINCPTWIRFLVYTGIEELSVYNDPFPETNIDLEMEIRKELGDNYIVLHSYNSRKGFEGRNTKTENIKKALYYISKLGYKTFDIGNDNTKPICRHLGSLSHEELFLIIKNSKGFVGIDSYPMHIAALYKKPIFGFFGSTHPFSVLPLFKRISFVRNEKLDCLNCLALNKIESEMVTCLNKNLYCEDISEDSLLKGLKQFFEILESNGTDEIHLDYLRYFMSIGKSEFELQKALELTLNYETKPDIDLLQKVLSPYKHRKILK